MTGQPHRGRKAMLARAAFYPGITDQERRTLIKFGAPGIAAGKALELIKQAQQLGLEFRHEEAEDIIERLLSGDISATQLGDFEA